MKLQLVSEIVEENGKTVRENNMDRKHNIPIDTLVQLKYDEWFGGGACMRAEARLFVVEHGRDCDGEPLYWLAPRPLSVIKEVVSDFFGTNDLDGVIVQNSRKFWLKASSVGLGSRGGYSESSLTPIKDTDAESLEPLTWTNE